MCHASPANLSELEVTLLMKIHVLSICQREEFGDQSKMVQNKRQTSRASYQWWAMDFGCFIRSCCLKLWFRRGEELWGDFWQLCGMVFALGFIAFLESCVFCQALAEALKQNSTLTYLNLARNNIGDEGSKAWCLVRMGAWGGREWRKAKEGSRHGPFEHDIREMTKGNALQRWFPDAFIRLKFVMTSDWGILMYLACIGQILVEKRNTS